MRLTKNQIKELVAKRVIYNLEDESEDTFFNRKMKNLVASAFIDDIRLNYYYKNGYKDVLRRYNELYVRNKIKEMERM